MKILITGGTGFIGKALCKALSSQHDIIVLSRDKAHAFDVLGSDITIIESLDELIEHKVSPHAIINLAGKNLAEDRWNDSVKREIIDSRITTTKNLIDFIKQTAVKPKVLINGSAIGYYGDTGDKVIKESEEPADDFAANLCKSWEAEANNAKRYDVRVVCIRISLVLGHGGALDKMLLPFKLCLCGPIGSGQQYMSWIHIDDLVRLIDFSLTNESISGPVNASTPLPVTNKLFSKQLAKALGRFAIFPMPGFALKIIAGEMAELLLGGQRVIPDKAVKAGFEFNYPELGQALDKILKA